MLNIRDKKDVSFIPDKLNKSFHHLEAVQVYNCSVKFIDATSFKNMQKLKYVNLAANQIETIDIGALADLVDLEYFSFGSKSNWKSSFSYFCDEQETY